MCPLRFGLVGCDAILGAHVRALQIADFIDAVREDRESFVSLAETRATMTVIEAIHESARSGRPVRP